MTIETCRKTCAAMLSPEDFSVLVQHALNKDKAFILAHPEYELDRKTKHTLQRYCERRYAHEPIAYITGHKEFYGRDFLVTPDTLIPRPETELLIELVLNEMRHSEWRSPVVADIGTGSGNIIITLAKEQSAENFPISSFFATDISARALAVARKNAARHGIDARISFHEGSLLKPIEKPLAAANAVIIIANLPYLSENIYLSASDDVRKFEPQTALVSGTDGLDHYRLLFEEAAALQKPIILFIEISPEQSPILERFFKERFPNSETSLFCDLSGRERVFRIAL
jgi:release factor glutamine methyltransferase